jgi:hypothetical protein
MSFVNFCITYNAVNQRSASYLELPPIVVTRTHTYFPTDPVAGTYDDDPSTPDSSSRAHTHSCHAWLWLSRPSRCSGASSGRAKQHKRTQDTSHDRNRMATLTEPEPGKRIGRLEHWYVRNGSHAGDYLTPRDWYTDTTGQVYKGVHGPPRTSTRERSRPPYVLSQDQPDPY